LKKWAWVLKNILSSSNIVGVFLLAHHKNQLTLFFLILESPNYILNWTFQYTKFCIEPFGIQRACHLIFYGVQEKLAHIVLSFHLRP